ncbi:MAG: pantetheine-phosphate adenylyltransferase [Gammaproteobacteria bacterium]|nr:pantetheine-phosphate adenylyltransferase [Gammaproteobacteria bacterium]
MITTLYPGTFDPITNGHLDIIRRASKLCSGLIVAIAESKKHTMFTLEERIQMAERVIASENISNVRVLGFNNLLINLCRENEVSVILRGLRAVSDFEYEFQLAGMNKHLDNDVETIFLPTSAKFSYLSSSLVKEVALLGGDINELVPALVKAELLKKIV